MSRIPFYVLDELGRGKRSEGARGYNGERE